MDRPHTDEPAREQHGAPGADGLGIALRGDLPCYQCRYNLRGLSIRDKCPECGSAVRATILYQVDPLADEFQPLPAPRLTALGLQMWSAGAAAAVTMCWVPRILDAVAFALPGHIVALRTPRALPALVTGSILLSSMGALGLLGASPRPRLRESALVAVGALAGLPLAFAVHYVLTVVDPSRAAPYFVAPASPDRLAARLVIALSLIVAILCARPAARLLVHRSLALRTGRVDRQTLLAMAGAVALAGLGDGLRALGASAPAGGELLDYLGITLVAIGSLLFTIGVYGAVADSFRIASAIRTPPPSLRQVLHGT